MSNLAQSPFAVNHRDGHPIESANSILQDEYLESIGAGESYPVDDRPAHVCWPSEDNCQECNHNTRLDNEHQARKAAGWGGRAKDEYCDQNGGGM